MKKILLAINCFVGNTHGSIGNIIYPMTWKKFLDRSRDRLKCQVTFISGGWDQHKELFSSTISPYSSFSTHLLLPAQADATFTSMSSTDHDFILQIDQDAFPPIDTINAVCDFIQTNEEVNLICPGNERCSISPENVHLMYSNSFFPWQSPFVSDCFLGIRKKLFTKALDLYNKYVPTDPISLTRPLITHKLNYGKVCSLLGQSVPKNISPDITINLSDPIGGDFWTMLCLVGIKQAELVNWDYRSFDCKMHINPSYISLFPDFFSAVDPEDKCKGFPKIVAPFFHTGASNCTYRRFEGLYQIEQLGPHGKELWENYYGDDFYNHKTNKFGGRADQYAIIELLTNATGNRSLLEKLSSSTKEIFNKQGIDLEQYRNYAESVQKLYFPAMTEYL